MKVVFLHGVGDGSADMEWLEGLNQGLSQVGAAPVELDSIIAPQYDLLLNVLSTRTSVTVLHQDIGDSVGDRGGDTSALKLWRWLSTNPSIL